MNVPNADAVPANNSKNVVDVAADFITNYVYVIVRAVEGSGATADVCTTKDETAPKGKRVALGCAGLQHDRPSAQPPQLASPPRHYQREDWSGKTSVEPFCRWIPQPVVEMQQNVAEWGIFEGNRFSRTHDGDVLWTTTAENSNAARRQMPLALPSGCHQQAGWPIHHHRPSASQKQQQQEQRLPLDCQFGSCHFDTIYSDRKRTVGTVAAAFTRIPHAAKGIIARAKAATTSQASKPTKS